MIRGRERDQIWKKTYVSALCIISQNDVLRKEGGREEEVNWTTGIGIYLLLAMIEKVRWDFELRKWDSSWKV